MEVKEYFIGERYSIHPSHTGNSFRFLNNPLNSMNGRMTTGVTTVTILVFSNIEPISNPRELPAKTTKNRVR